MTVSKSCVTHVSGQPSSDTQQRTAGSQMKTTHAHSLALVLNECHPMLLAVLACLQRRAAATDQLRGIICCCCCCRHRLLCCPTFPQPTKVGLVACAACKEMVLLQGIVHRSAAATNTKQQHEPLTARLCHCRVTVGTPNVDGGS